MICLCLAVISSCNNNDNTTNSSQGYPISEVPFTSVHVEDQFWSPRFRTHKEVTIPSAFRKCEETGRIDNFKVAGGLQEGTVTCIRPWPISHRCRGIQPTSKPLSGSGTMWSTRRFISQGVSVPGMHIVCFDYLQRLAAIARIHQQCAHLPCPIEGVDIDLEKSFQDGKILFPPPLCIKTFQVLLQQF